MLIALQVVAARVRPGASRPRNPSLFLAACIAYFTAAVLSGDRAAAARVSSLRIASPWSTPAWTPLRDLASILYASGGVVERPRRSCWCFPFWRHDRAGRSPRCAPDRGRVRAGRARAAGFRRTHRHGSSASTYVPAGFLGGSLFRRLRSPHGRWPTGCARAERRVRRPGARPQNLRACSRSTSCSTCARASWSIDAQDRIRLINESAA